MPRPIPADEQFIDMAFPVKGIDLSRAFGLQVPGTTPIGQNVRSFDAYARRMRGGQRPGLSKFIPNAVPGTAGLIQELNVIVGVGYTDPAPTGGSYVVQTTAGSTGTGTTLANVFSSPVTSGNGIVVCVGSTNGGVAFPSTVTDGTNTYTRIDNSSVSNVAASIWLATNVSGAIATVTSNFASGGSSYFSYALEVANLTASPVDAAREPTGVGTTGAGLDFTTTHAPDIAVGCVCANQTVSRTAGNWFDLQNGQKLWVGWRPLPTVTSAGADLAWAFGANTFWAGCLKSLKSNA